MPAGVGNEIDRCSPRPEAKPAAFATEILHTPAAVDANLAEWQSFIRSSGTRGATLDNDPVHLQLRLEGRNSQPPERPFIILLRRGGQLRCIAPLYIKKSPYRVRIGKATLGSLPALQPRMLRLFGGRGQIVVAADEDISDCAQTIFQLIWKHRAQFDVVCLENLVQSSPLWNYCLKAFGGGGRFKCYPAAHDRVLQLRLPATHDEYLSQLRPRTRQNLRRMTRKLCNEHHARLERITTADQVPQFLADVDAITRDSWAADLEGFRPHTEAQVRYFKSMAQSGWLRSYVLVSDEGPIAYDVAFQYDGVLCGRKCGFVQRWAELSPGTVLRHLMIEDLFQHQPPRMFDFGPGDYFYKHSFRSNLEYDIAFLYLIPPTIWRLVYDAQEVLKLAYPPVRSWLVRSHLDTAGRKLARVTIAAVGAPFRWLRRPAGGQP